MDQHERESLLKALTDEADRLGAEPNDEKGIIRALVEGAGLSFCAWLCVCMDLADRHAQREGFRDQSHRAFTRASEKLRIVH